MKYEITREITAETFAARGDDGREVFLDKVDFAIPPRDNVRYEIQSEIQKRIDRAEAIQHDALLKYSGFIKHQDGLYLIREMGESWQGFEPEQLGETCRSLLNVLQVIRAFHDQGVVVGGLSQGMLKRAASGKLIVQEPWIFNYLSNRLADENYRFERAPEVIRGQDWGKEADVFSWGVLAYQMITGRHPFFAKEESDRIAQVLRGKIVPPKDYCPRLGMALSDLISGALNVDPAARPELKALITCLTEQINEGTYEVSEAEANEYALKAESRHKQHESREKTWLWFRRYGSWVAVGAICLVILLGMTFGFHSKPTISRDTPPRAVISYYFQGVREINVALMMETMHHAKNSLDGVVSNIHVINMQNLSMNGKSKDNIRIKVDPLKTRLLSQSSKQIRYKINYTYVITLPTTGRVERSEREDIFTLKPVHNVWKITEIKILKERHSRTAGK